MKDFLIFSIVCIIIIIVILSVLIGAGLGVGFILHWMIPSIEIGMATLIGLIASALTFTIFGLLVFSLDKSINTVDLHDINFKRKTIRSKRKPRKDNCSIVDINSKGDRLR
jgi:hypothetical protein